MSLEWFFNNASVLLWADRILVTSKDFETLHLQKYFDDDTDRECARIFFDRLRDEGIIEVFQPDKYLSEPVLASIEAQALRDAARWGVDPGLPNESGQYEHNIIQISGNGYCIPVVRGVYGSLTLARFLRCSCVFDTRERAFVNDRFTLLGNAAGLGLAGQRVFSELYSVLLPGLQPERDFMLFCHPERGRTCGQADSCRQNARDNLERMTEHILVSREKPELVSLAQMSAIKQFPSLRPARIR